MGRRGAYEIRPVITVTIVIIFPVISRGGIFRGVYENRPVSIVMVVIIPMVE